MFDSDSQSRPRASFLFPTIWFSAILLGLLLTSANGQTPVQAPVQVPVQAPVQDSLQFNEDDKSVVAIDIQVEALLAQAEKLGFDLTVFDNDNSPLPLGKIKISEVERLLGAMSIPLDALKASKEWAVGSESPVDYFVQAQFKDANDLKRHETEVIAGGEQLTINGKKFYSYPQSTTSNLVVHRYDEKSLEYGTSLYCSQPNRDFRTDRLDQVFRSLPNQPVRVAIDLKSSEAAVSDFIEDAKSRIKQPVVAAYYDLVGDVETLTISLDLSAEKLFSIVAKCGDETQAEEIAEGVNSMLATGKLAYNAQWSSSAPDNQKAFGFVKQMVETLVAQQDGKTVKVELAKPEGFEKSVQALLAYRTAKSEAKQRRLDLIQILAAIFTFNGSTKELPFGNVDSRNEKLSWRASILPLLPGLEDYASMDRMKGPADPANAAFAEKMPKLFGPDGRSAIYCWIESNVKSYDKVPDGNSSTVMLIEIPKGRPWLEQNPLTVKEAVAMVKGLPDGQKLLVGFYNGSTQELSNQVDEKTLEWLFTPDDGHDVKDFLKSFEPKTKTPRVRVR